MDIESNRKLQLLKQLYCVKDNVSNCCGDRINLVDPKGDSKLTCSRCLKVCTPANWSNQ